MDCPQCTPVGRLTQELHQHQPAQACTSVLHLGQNRKKWLFAHASGDRMHSTKTEHTDCHTLDMKDQPVEEDSELNRIRGTVVLLTTLSSRRHMGCRRGTGAREGG